MKKCLLSLMMVLAVLSCRRESDVQPLQMPGLMEIPPGFPPMEIPSDNAFTQARWELGKRLFFETVLSADSTISCASCHRQAFAFGDSTAVSPGVAGRPGTRNVPTLTNVGYQPYFTREGGVPTLEMQVLVPIQEHNEFDFNIVLITERLNRDSSYVAMALEAYERTPDPFVVTRALACFERALISGNSPYDQYQYQGKADALSPAAYRGMVLFFSERTNCSACHAGFNFTNATFENNGLYKDYPDPGRFRLTGIETDRALFKVPTLRNVAVTGPYMHDGSLSSLEEVIAHYQSGGKHHVHQSLLVRPLSLTQSEQDDLLQFLFALTDEDFIRNPLFKKQ